MATKVGYSEGMPDFYRATLKKVIIVLTDDGGQEYQVIVVIPRNEATRDLGDFVGHPVMLAIKQVQAALPLIPL